MKKKEGIQKVVYGITGAFGLMPTDSNIKISELSMKVAAATSEALGYPGKILFGSKSYGYDISHKKGWTYVSNSNLFIQSGEKVWFGDVLTDEKTVASLQLITKTLGVTLYILSEHDGRFLKEPPDNKYLEEKYRVKITSDEVISKK